MAEHSRDDAIRHRAAVRERETRASLRLRKAADAVTDAGRVAASIVSDARSSARQVDYVCWVFVNDSEKQYR